MEQLAEQSRTAPTKKETSARWNARFRRLRVRLPSREPIDLFTVEVALYLLLASLAALTRFWDLGSRAFHHDENLHAYFSWLYYKGHGYVHDPMMHGPFLFHANALVYSLFGASDYTARVVPALFGTVLVFLPFLLRRQLGRISMLAASFLLLISPLISYYSRFIRNDIYCGVWMMLIFVGLVRWMDSRDVRWAYVSWIAFAFLYSTKEVSYITAFIFVTFLVGVFLLAHSRGALIWLVSLPIGLLTVMKLLPVSLHWPALPAIPFEQPSVGKSIDYARTMLSAPQVLLAILWGVLWLIVLLTVLRRGRIREQLAHIRIQDAPGNALSCAVAVVPRWRVQLALLVAGFLIVAVPLYTSLFTHTADGLMSGSFGQLFYWLAQHAVRRGDQPWYYYLVLEPVYEPIGVLLSTTALIYAGWWALRRRARLTTAPNTFVLSYALLAYWVLMSLLIYSWAGEKMPWLSVEITLPMILLGSVFGTRALGLEEGWRPCLAARRKGVWVFVGATAITVGWIVFRMAVWVSQPYPTTQSPLVWGAGVLLFITIAAIVWLGPRAAVHSLSMLALLVLIMYTIRSALRLDYVNGDVPVEQAVYVQTTPYVPRIMQAMAYVSEHTVGGKQAKILYGGGNGSEWAFMWYMRNFPNAQYVGDGPTSTPQDDVEFVLIYQDNQKKVEPYLQDYTPLEYPLRWWFPEDMYRQIVPASKLQRTVTVNGKEQTEPVPLTTALVVNVREIASRILACRKPANQAMIWKYVLYRQPSDSLQSVDETLYVRKDLMGLYNEGRFQR